MVNLRLRTRLPAMSRKIRIILALVFFTLITLLFLDFTGTAHAWFGWMAKTQFLPAVLGLNVAMVVILLLLTLLLGRVYCSVICPMGVFQDIVAWLGKRGKRNPYSYSPAKSWLRYGVLVAFVVLLLAGFTSIAALLAPYSSYGRIANNLLQPLWMWGNNLLAYFAERVDSYAFYSVDVWLRSLPTFLIAVFTLLAVGFLAWRHGRTYCNTICPVGTVLGFVAKYSWLKPVIDTSKCVNCGLCGRNCKAACINTKEHRIDYSRCVACMDCLENCHVNAIHYTHPKRKDTSTGDRKVDQGLRSFLALTSATAVAAVAKAQDKKVDGGLAAIEDKQIPNRLTPLLPPGAWSAQHMAQHCTGCQLCVSVCPNGVLRPSGNLMTLMQPEMSFERGYCRPECTKCGEVCPTGAIQPVERSEKSAIHIGHAVWIKKNCVVLTDNVNCGNCARHCPTGAIQMIPIDPKDEKSLRIPAVNVERCIGCGACENLCPARPFSAIYVEGHEAHRVN